jgi:hypothetical protein
MLGKAEGEGRPNTGPGRYGWCCGTKVKVSAQDAVSAIWQTITSINQARVHLWFETKFGEAYTALACTAEALERFTSATFAVGVRLEPDDHLHIEAPFGLADLFALRLVPILAERRPVSPALYGCAPSLA